jgi:hypothetical protein
VYGRGTRDLASGCLVNTLVVAGVIVAGGGAVAVVGGPWADSVATCRHLNEERALVKVHVLKVDRKPANIAELEDGIAAGRTVDDWQMPKDPKPGDLVIWYAAGQQKYIARGWVDAIPAEVREGPGPYRGPVAAMERIEPCVDRKKVIRDCGIDGGVESYQTRVGSRPWTFDRLNALTCQFTSQVDEICALK